MRAFSASRAAGFKKPLPLHGHDLPEVAAPSFLVLGHEALLHGEAVHDPRTRAAQPSAQLLRILDVRRPQRVSQIGLVAQREGREQRGGRERQSARDREQGRE